MTYHTETGRMSSKRFRVASSQSLTVRFNFLILGIFLIGQSGIPDDPPTVPSSCASDKYCVTDCVSYFAVVVLLIFLLAFFGVLGINLFGYNGAVLGRCFAILYSNLLCSSSIKKR
jgi:hypothetical protein